MKTKNLAAVALGSIKTEKKARAAKINGCLGGRPKKIISENNMDTFGIPLEQIEGNGSIKEKASGKITVIEAFTRRSRVSFGLELDFDDEKGIELWGKDGFENIKSRLRNINNIFNLTNSGRITLLLDQEEKTCIKVFITIGGRKKELIDGSNIEEYIDRHKLEPIEEIPIDQEGHQTAYSLSSDF